MHNDSLAADYLQRAKHRLVALKVLADLESWADVVRESQEVVEITLKALLRASRIEVPRLHDVSAVIEENRGLLPSSLDAHIDELCAVSRSLRRDRELAFYGSEDLTPSEFYKKSDATTALAQASRVVELVSEAVLDNDH
jgi:HEPN domain-containing protein